MPNYFQPLLCNIKTCLAHKGRFRIYEIWRGQHLPQILISLANDIIYTNNFIHVPLLFLRIPKIQKSKIFCPHLVTHPTSPPSQHIQNILHPPLRHIKKFSTPPLRDASKIFASHRRCRPPIS